MKPHNMNTDVLSAATVVQ